MEAKKVREGEWEKMGKGECGKMGERKRVEEELVETPTFVAKHLELYRPASNQFYR
jgi:hypothetical protein